MGTGRIDQTSRIYPTVRKTSQTQPLDEQSMVKRQAQTDRLAIRNGPSRASSLSDVVANAKAESSKKIGNSIVDGSRALHQRGYTYPPDLGANYYHKYNATGKSVGCCADFVSDSYKEMSKSLGKPGYDIGQIMKDKGYNPHYSPSMIQYFQKEQTLLPPPSKGTKAQVGDVVFFDWDGNGAKDPDHVAIVTKVDAHGNPTELMESRKFNQPTEITAITPGDSRWDKIVGIGRLKDATADNDAANALPPLGDAPFPGDSHSGGGRASADYSGGGRGNGGPVSSDGPTRTVPSRTGEPSNYQPFRRQEWESGISSALGLALEIVQKLSSALANDGEMSVDQLAKLAEKDGVPKDKAMKLAKEIMAKKSDLVASKAASPDMAKYMGKLSPEKIEEIFRERNSPLAGKGLGEFIVQMEQKYGIPAAQFLAQATMESQIGRVGSTQGEHHNIGNIRPGSSWDGPTLTTGNGSYRSYGSWEEGVEDFYKLMSGPLYAGKSLEDQINTYAPPSENNTNGYIDTIKALMRGWTGE